MRKVSVHITPQKTWNFSVFEEERKVHFFCSITSLSLAGCWHGKDWVLNQKSVCIKNFKYIQRLTFFIETNCNMSEHQTLWNEKLCAKGCSCLHFHSLWPEIPCNYIWQPALYLNLIMSFCIQSNKGLLNDIMKICIIIYCSPLNENPCKWAMLVSLFLPLPLASKIHTEIYGWGWATGSWYRHLWMARCGTYVSSLVNAVVKILLGLAK